jgi:hypothetical protein
MHAVTRRNRLVPQIVTANLRGLPVSFWRPMIRPSRFVRCAMR